MVLSEFRGESVSVIRHSLPKLPQFCLCNGDEFPCQPDSASAFGVTCPVALNDCLHIIKISGYQMIASLPNKKATLQVRKAYLECSWFWLWLFFRLWRRSLGNVVHKHGVRNRVRVDDVGSMRLPFFWVCKFVWIPGSILNFRIRTVSSIGGIDCRNPVCRHRFQFPDEGSPQKQGFSVPDSHPLKMGILPPPPPKKNKEIQIPL